MAVHSFDPITPVIRLDPPPRSRSRSPERRTTFSAHIADPLLSNLSPESTLQALSAVDALRAAPGSAHDILVKSIANVSPADRAFGIRAALAAQKLKQWYKEVRSWQWPARNDAEQGKGFIAPPEAGNPSDCTSPEHQYLGSLPVEVVTRYESRIEEIRDELDALDVDELKEHVLDQHIPIRSRPASASSSISNLEPAFSYFQLSDFSAVVTATILYALPVLSRLNMLLERWSVRIKVLRLIPGLRSSLSQTQNAIRSAMDRIREGLLPESDDQSFSKASFAVARHTLEAKVLRVGALMDTILDLLEGHMDALPEAWIDEMEAIESDFATWAAFAERKALENDWISKLTSEEVQQSIETSKISRNECKPLAATEIPILDSERPPVRQQQQQRPSNNLPEADNQSLTGEPSGPTPMVPQEQDGASVNSPVPDIRVMNGSTIISDTDFTQSLIASTSLSSVASQLDIDRNEPLTHGRLKTSENPANSSKSVSMQRTDEFTPHNESSTTLGEGLAQQRDSVSSTNDDAQVAVSGEADSNCRTASLPQSTVERIDEHNELEGSHLSVIEHISEGNAASQPHKTPEPGPGKAIHPSSFSVDRGVQTVGSGFTSYGSDVESDGEDISRVRTPKESHFTPLVIPDSPPSPIEPLKPSKRSSMLSSESTMQPNNPLRLKRLEPPLEITSKPPSKAAPPSPTKSFEDPLDEKINSILTSIPARIHLASEGSSDSDEQPNLRRTSRSERARSSSPASVVSSTPSITLTRTRRNRGHTDESVKVYHLHRGGKTVPTKLFVRSVGEDGERVMVRVGGGWADLGEYLREYVMHHGRRNVMEEKFEIRGIPSRNVSSNYPSSGRFTPTPGSGRTTPVSRPGSAFDIRRPSSSLSVRHTRRLTGTEADLPAFRSPRFQSPDHTVEDPDSPPAQRRFSVSSSISTDGPTTPKSRPLGLAGPKPRSRNVSISPESEKWVEEVMDEARKKTASLRRQLSSGTLRNLPPVAENEGNKLRRVSDIGYGGVSSRRVYLRGLNK
ncbi:hypothetical protein VTO42DRAFT_8066 [Malbranchea cinnamomea]